MTEIDMQVLDLAKRVDGLINELEQLAAQAGSLTEARAADLAACTGSEPDVEHSTVPPEGRSSCLWPSTDGVSAERVISLSLIQKVVSNSTGSIEASLSMLCSDS